MKAIIFGATGTVGTELVRQTLDKGYDVTAFVRNPGKIDQLHHQRLFIYKGDVTKPDDVISAMQRQDVVFCVLGDGRAGKIRAIGTRNIINAMNQAGIKRFICQSTLGIGESYSNLNFFWRYIMFGMLLKKAFKDHKQQEQ